jgi:hypothetical protein
VSVAQADAALMELARDLAADIVACQVILSESPVKGYERRGKHGLEMVRSYDRVHLHESGVGEEGRRLVADELERQRQFMGRAADNVDVHVLNPGVGYAEGFYNPHRIELHPVVFGGVSHETHRISNRYVPADKEHSEAAITLAHEIGHHVAEILGEKDAIAALAHALGIDPPDLSGTPQQQWSAKFTWWGRAEKKVRKLVSLYGKESLSEAQAELWGEYTTNKHPRPAAKRYGKFVRARLKERGLL